MELHEELPSTNSRLLQWAREGAEPFCVVLAESQTEGRGRAGRRWISPPGAGLWVSVLLPPPSGGLPGVTSLAVGVAAALAMEEVAGVSVGLKWPNDLLVRAAPHRPGPGKVGGVLCEAATGPGGDRDGMVAGVGINLRRRGPRTPSRGSGALVSEADDAGGLEDAAFLEQAAGRPVKASTLAAALVRQLRGWADPPPDRLEGELREAWEARDVIQGRRVRTDMAPDGVALGPGPEGWLRVSDQKGNVHTVRGGSVRPAGEGASFMYAGHGEDDAP